MKKDEFLAELRANLKKKHVPKNSIDDALAYYDEAIHDRMEDGMSEEKAVAAMGSIDDAVQSALESMPAFLRATQRIRSDSVLMSITIVLLVIGAIVWIPLTFALALTALSIYFCNLGTCYFIMLCSCLWSFLRSNEHPGTCSGISARHVPFRRAFCRCVSAHRRCFHTGNTDSSSHNAFSRAKRTRLCKVDCSFLCTSSCREDHSLHGANKYNVMVRRTFEKTVLAVRWYFYRNWPCIDSCCVCGVRMQPCRFT